MLPSKMKTFFVLLIWSQLLGCISASTKRGQNDALVAVHNIPKELSSENYTEREYFLINQNDTSGFSCILSENKISKYLSMRFEYSPDRKTATSFSLTDTSAVSEHKSIKKAYRELSYEEQHKELRSILNFISKDYKINRLKEIKMSMRSFKELSLSITRKYLDQFGEKFDYKSKERLKKLIEESAFTADVNKILSFYSIVIDKISVLEFVYYSPQDDEIEEDIERGELGGKNRKHIIDGMIKFDLRAM